MRSRLTLGATILGLGVLITILILLNRHPTQNPQDKGKPPGSPGKEGPPSGDGAFFATYGIKDPWKKLEALEKFVSDYPKSSQIANARREIFKATVKVWPDDKRRVLDAASRMIKPPGSPGAKTANIPEYQSIANELLTAGILLDEAETYALKSLEFNREDFLGVLKAEYAEWKRPMPSNEIVDRKYIEEKAAYRTTLGRIYVKKGRTLEGERILRESHEAIPTHSQTALGLAELAEKKGDNETAADFLATATLTAGYGIADVRSRFESLYRKTHNGSTDGLEGLLDDRYRKLFPNPIEFFPYRPDASRSNRLALVEFFTGAG